MVAEVFLPGPEAGVRLAAGAFAGPGAVGLEVEGEGPFEVPVVDRQVAGVVPPGGAGPPEQPGPDAALVERLGQAQVRLEVEQAGRGLDPGRGKEDPSLDFIGLEMTPGQAVLFSGSSQWHYREPMPVGTGPQHCDLLFFHFVPAGEAELVDPDNWATLFGIPELQHE